MGSLYGSMYSEINGGSSPECCRLRSYGITCDPVWVLYIIFRDKRWVLVAHQGQLSSVEISIDFSLQRPLFGGYLKVANHPQLPVAGAHRQKVIHRISRTHLRGYPNHTPPITEGGYSDNSEYIPIKFRKILVENLVSVLCKRFKDWYKCQLLSRVNRDYEFLT